MNFNAKVALERLQQSSNIYLPIDQFDAILEEIDKKEFSSIEKAEEYLKEDITQFKKYFSQKEKKEQPLETEETRGGRPKLSTLTYRNYNFYRLSSRL